MAKAPSNFPLNADLDRLGITDHDYDHERRCGKCLVIKPIVEFMKSKKTLSGYGYRCNVCHKKDVGIYQKTKKGRKVHAKNNSKWEHNNRIKKNAHCRVKRALESGKLKKIPCIICGNLKVEGHHYDYSKPLEVIWVCSKHHSEIHSKNIPEEGLQTFYFCDHECSSRCQNDIDCPCEKDHLCKNSSSHDGPTCALCGEPWPHKTCGKNTIEINILGEK